MNQGIVFTEKERKYLLKDTLCALESTVNGAKELKLNDIKNWQKKHTFDLPKSEVTLAIQIIKKLVRR